MARTRLRRRGAPRARSPRPPTACRRTNSLETTRSYADPGRAGSPGRHRHRVTGSDAGRLPGFDRKRQHDTRAPPPLAGDGDRARRSVRRSAARSTGRGRFPPPWSRSRARTAGRARLRPCRRRCRSTSVRTNRSSACAGGDRQRAPARHRVQRVVDDVGQRPADERPVHRTRPGATSASSRRNSQRSLDPIS